MKKLFLAIASALMLLSCAHDPAMCPKSTWKIPQPQDRRAEDMCFLMNRHCHYALYHRWEVLGDTIAVKGYLEPDIRPIASDAFTLAFCCKAGIIEPQMKEPSLHTAKALIRSMARTHKANREGPAWGDHWQSAHWTAFGAVAAWFLWDELAPEVREEVRRMTVHEADRFIDYKVPYYMDREGKVLTPGDSKAEENAWNSEILEIASIMFPGHPNREAWDRKSIELQLSSYAAPDDWKTPGSIDGVPFSILAGSNIFADGTLVNHNRVHPDYMSAFMLNVLNRWFRNMAGQEGRASSLHNGALVYHALTDLELPTGTIYTVDSLGRPSYRINYPQENDWGAGRQDNFWLMDIIAHVHHLDSTSSHPAVEWADARMVRMKEMIQRDTTGQYYQSRSENSFHSREEFFGLQVALGYIGYWLGR